MDTDLFLTIGIILVVLSLPSLLSAWVDGRPPRVGGIMLLAAAGLIIAAISQKPGGYSFSDIPHVMLNTAARALR